MTEAPKFEIKTSRNFTQWLALTRVSLLVTTYQAGRLFLLGRKPDGGLDVFNRSFNRAMGLYADPERMFLSTRYQLWRFDNALQPGQQHQGYDRMYVPQVAYTTADLDIHDIAMDRDGRPVFVNTLFGCLATVSERYSFEPLWRPRFLSRLAAEDCCHLNGLAMRDGQPAFVTCVSQSDVADGWRDRRRDGGVVVDVASNEVVLAGLSMPHSPRWFRGRLWLLDSGNGWFGYLDAKTGKFERVTFCPGYGRGLAFVDNYAVIGLSAPREHTFAGLALDGALAARDAVPRCGLVIVDLTTGATVEWLRIEGVISELYDVCVLPDVARPMAVGIRSEEIHRIVSMPPG